MYVGFDSSEKWTLVEGCDVGTSYANLSQMKGKGREKENEGQGKAMQIREDKWRTVCQSQSQTHQIRDIELELCGFWTYEAS